MKIEITTGNHPIHDKKYIIETDNIIAFWDNGIKDVVTGNTTTIGYNHTLIFLLAVNRGEPARLEITRFGYIKDHMREPLWGDIVWKIYDILKPVKL